MTGLTFMNLKKGGVVNIFELECGRKLQWFLFFVTKINGFLYEQVNSLKKVRKTEFFKDVF